MKQSVLQKKLFAVFKFKVTATACIFKIQLFVLDLLNCWSICNQTWFDSTASSARVSCEKVGLLHSESRSQRRFKMSMNVCPDDIF